MGRDSRGGRRGPEPWSLEVDGIAGETTDARHATPIDSGPWSFGAAPAAVAPGGSGTGTAG
jgi:hypothetical protein